MAFAVSRVAQAGEDIVFRQIGKVSEDFLVAHTRSKVRQHVVDRDAHASDTGLPTALARLDGDDVLIVHARIIRRDGVLPQARLEKRPKRSSVPPRHQEGLFRRTL